ncbi:formimidoylglutamase [Macrococcus equipercicus]|uniref:Formimidoylglutamase n=1 Tax=Macrococcus equipercicus TaxID=69967 RepID=A0ABQ6R7B6_9STAP|nr:formimidoylglutamase [Macrococcus equipercicus]KAA1038374.1 formimidoylglutamase [Macrococcus equipercicus]
MHRQPIKALWTGRLDSESDERHFRYFQTIDLSGENTGAQVALLGYAVDEGVRLNKGRQGAVEGPDAIKTAFAGLPVIAGAMVSDYGNITHDHDTLLETQQELAAEAAELLQRHQLTFLLGGGHDIAYAQYLAVRQAYPGKTVGVINIDAHFDTRHEAQSTSGNSFSQIIEQDDEAGYLVLGIQPSGNTQALFDYAERHDISYVLAERFNSGVPDEVVSQIQQFIDSYDVILFTICMDVIDSAFAPGVSAPAVLGLSSHVVAELAATIASCDKVSSVSIAEMNPVYDIDNRTAKLIAYLMNHMIGKKFS